MQLRHLTTGTFARPEDLSDRGDPAVLYARSYLLIRAAVGGLGIGLPLLLWAVDALLLQGSPAARGSLSAYYFSGARDVFVGALCVIGVLLVTYLAAQPDTWDFWLSLVAGVAAIGVALLPTTRPAAYDGPPTPLQQHWGEHLVAALHFSCAAVLVLALAGIAFLAARREVRHRGHRAVARLHRACGAAIVAAVAWAAAGMVLDLDVGRLTSLYVGEVASTWAFGLSWTVQAWDLWRGLRGRPGRRGSSDRDLSRRRGAVPRSRVPRRRRSRPALPSPGPPRPPSTPPGTPRPGCVPRAW